MTTATGLDYEMAKKLKAKRDPEMETKLVNWIESVIGEPLPANRPIEDNVYDGVYLCRLMNKLAPGSVKKINVSVEKFKMMENAAQFDAAAVKYGVHPDNLFRSVDLIEKKNTPEVVSGIINLARAAVKKGFKPAPDPSVFAQ